MPMFEVTESKRLIESWTGTEVSSFCYPFYRTNTFLADPVKKAGYKQARAGCSKRFYSPHEAMDWFNIDCRQVSQRDKVEEWVKPDSWHILTSHGIGDARSGWEPVTVGRFAAMTSELAEYRKSRAVEIVTFKEGAERFRRGTE